MFTRQTSAAQTQRSSLAKVLKVVDRIGLGVMYALVFAGLPIAAIGVVTQTF